MSRTHGRISLAVTLCLPLAIVGLAFASFPSEAEGRQAQDDARDIHGDLLPPGAVGRFGSSRFCAAGQIFQVAVTPDGTRIATAANTGTTDVIEVWEVPWGRKLLRLEDRREFGSTVDFSPDGKSLAIGGTAKTVGLWDFEKGRRTIAFTGTKGKIGLIRFLPGGDQVFAVDKGGFVGIWDAKTGEPVERETDLSAIRRPIAISPDGRLAVTADRDTYIWSLETGRQLRKIAGREFGISDVAFSPDGKLLATSGYGDALRVWDVESGQGRGVFPGESFLSVAISPDGKKIAAGDRSNRIKVWDLLSGEVLHTFGPHHEAVVDLAFFADGKTLVSVSHDDSIRLWDLAKGVEISRPEGHETGVRAAAFTPDGTTIVSAGSDGTIRFWDVETFQQVRVIRAHDTGIVDMELSHDGKTIATTDKNGKAGLWRVATGKRLHWLKGHSGYVWSVTFAPDDKVVATGGRDRTARIWDVGSGKEKARLTGHKEGISVVAFSPDGKLLASGDIGFENLDKYKIRIWDVAKAELVRVVRGNDRSVHTLVFLSQGDSLLSRGGDDYMRVWEVSSGEEIFSLHLPGARGRNTCLTPDGQFAALTSYPPAAAIVEMSTGIFLFRSPGRGDMKVSGALALSPDGEKLVSRNPSSALILFDLPSLAKAPEPGADLPDEATVSRLWSDLAVGEGPPVFHALYSLVRYGDGVVPFLRKHLEEERESTVRRAKKILPSMKSDDPEVREEAARELTKLGRWGAKAIQEELKTPLDAEVRERLEGILESLAPPYREFPNVAARHTRLRWVLERMGSDAARALAALLEEAREGPVAETPPAEGSPKAIAMAEIRRLMKDGSWKRAIKKLKTYGRRHADTPEEEEQASHLRKEAEGRLAFEKIEAAYEKRKRLRETAVKLSGLMEEYGDIPGLLETAEALLETVRAKFVFVIEDFEPGRGSRVLMRRHPGHSVVKKPEPVKRGEQAGKWDPVAANSVTYTFSWVKSMDWSEYNELCLWVYNEEKERDLTKCRIVIMTDPPPFAGHHDFWFTVDWVGWKELRVALQGGKGGFQRHGQADWSKTERIMIHQEKGDPSVLFFDDIRLEKRVR